MGVSIEMKECIERQWSELVSKENDLRVSFLRGYAKLDVSGILLHCEVEADRPVSDEFDEEDLEPKFGNSEQIANLAVILSKDVGVNIKTYKISARPGSAGERILETLKGAEELAEILRLVKECLLSLHHFLYREAKQDRKVVRDLIYIPEN